MAEVTSRPILFSGAMVRALLDGSKTQTRRVVKPQPSIAGVVKSICFERHPFSESAFKGTPAEGHGLPEQMAWVAYDWIQNPIGVEDASWLKCPYGKPGDRLWVRETWVEGFHYEGGEPLSTDENGEDIPKSIFYKADYPNDELQWWEDECVRAETVPWKSPIFMPRRASRIELEIVSVRVERLNEISLDDCLAEGIKPDNFGGPTHNPWHNGRAVYQELWESINGKGSWNLNPWVWVIEFKAVKE